MLTRLKVSGFKNLAGVDVSFGPFTCIAGANGVGKSNLFDVIMFLSSLADKPLMNAAMSVRDERGRIGDVQNLFQVIGNEHQNRISIEAEMIVPERGRDELGQEAKATITFLRYSVTIGYRQDKTIGSQGELEVLKEELTYINRTAAKKHLLFTQRSDDWFNSVMTGKRTSPFISTEGEGASRIVKLHQDGVKGRHKSLLAVNLPRTVLSTANAAENPTALMAKKEMQSWRLLQLEPSSLRKPDEFSSPVKLDADGSHLAATLYHLAGFKKNQGMNSELNKETEAKVFAAVANRLTELIDDVYEVRIDRDERRELLTLEVIDRDNTPYPARSLSDGTLRFLALAVLELDTRTHGLICMEEPENGIHPARIPAMLRLLQNIATDITVPVSSDNPLRQVIINTHSPAVVNQVPDESLLVAELKEKMDSGQRFKGVCLSCLSDTWRVKISPTVSKGKLLAYLNPVALEISDQDNIQTGLSENILNTKPGTRRVVDRKDIQMLLPFSYSSKK